MQTVWRDALFVLWFFLPAGMANMAPIIAAHLPVLRTLDFPLDGYATVRKRRVFGSHKTVRGLLSGTIMGLLTVFCQVWLYAAIPVIPSFVVVDYSTLNPWFLGLLMSLGALMGDAIRSFFKRQLDIAPGQSWFPFDQVDYVLGGIVFTAWYIQLTLQQYVLLFCIWFLLHPIATFIGYHLQLKERPL